MVRRVLSNETQRIFKLFPAKMSQEEKVLSYKGDLLVRLRPPGSISSRILRHVIKPGMETGNKAKQNEASLQSMVEL